MWAGQSLGLQGQCGTRLDPVWLQWMLRLRNWKRLKKQLKEARKEQLPALHKHRSKWRQQMVTGLMKSLLGKKNKKYLCFGVYKLVTYLNWTAISGWCVVRCAVWMDMKKMCLEEIKRHAQKLLTTVGFIHTNHCDAEIGNLACLLWYFQGAEWIRVSTGRLDKVVHGFLWRVANANCTCKAVAWAKVTHGEISSSAGWTDKSSWHKSQGILQQSTVRKHSLQIIATSIVSMKGGKSETRYWRKIPVGLQESENNNSFADIVDYQMLPLSDMNSAISEVLLTDYYCTAGVAW